jgi:hypothetical protein
LTYKPRKGGSRVVKLNSSTFDKGDVAVFRKVCSFLQNNASQKITTEKTKLTDTIQAGFIEVLDKSGKTLWKSKEPDAKSNGPYTLNVVLNSRLECANEKETVWTMGNREPFVACPTPAPTPRPTPAPTPKPTPKPTPAPTVRNFLVLLFGLIVSSSRADCILCSCSRLVRRQIL